MKIQQSLILGLVFYEFEPGHNAMEVFKNDCCMKAKGAVDHNTVTR